MATEKLSFRCWDRGTYSVYVGDVKIGTIRKVHVGRGHGERLLWFVSDQFTNDLPACTSDTRRAAAGKLHVHWLGSKKAAR